MAKSVLSMYLHIEGRKDPGSQLCACLLCHLPKLYLAIVYIAMSNLYTLYVNVH